MVRLVLVVMVVSVLGVPVFGGELADLVDRHLGDTIADRRWLHEHPELSGREVGTRAYIADRVSEMPGIREVPGDWGNGLVYVLEGDSAGPTLLWRADMDGLPITEDTGLPFASQVRDTLRSGEVAGVMHACGHDIHMSVALGSMRVLADVRDQIAGRIVFIFQPAEETGKGARMLIEAGLLEGDLRPDRVFAIHDHPTLLAGQAGVCAGPANANVDTILITVMGTGGHGAYPHRAVDPVTLACRMVLAINDVVAREIDPRHPAVISFGKIQGGTKSNVIPDRVELAATVRTHHEATRDLLDEKVGRTVRGLALAAGAPAPKYRFRRGMPAGWNDPEITRQVLDVATRVLGPDNAVEYPTAMGGEDFGRFTRRIPGVQFRLGVGRPDRDMALHSPTFDPDEAAIATGMRLVPEILLDQLGR